VHDDSSRLTDTQSSSSTRWPAATASAPLTAAEPICGSSAAAEARPAAPASSSSCPSPSARAYATTCAPGSTTTSSSPPCSRRSTGGNESARVQCIRFLADLELYREEDREQQVGAETARYVERLAQLLRDRGYRQHRAGKSELAEELTQAARQLWDESETVDGVVVADVSPSDARAVLEGLADLGLIRPPLRPRERDELAEKDAEIARLKTALSEFTAVA
jgi:hypothetical protein